MTPPSHRRFRFSLRTFFVVVAVLGIGCAWVSREVAIVRERKAVLSLIRPKPEISFFEGWHVMEHEEFRPTAWRKFLGDSAVIRAVWHPRVAALEVVERVKAAFPEATVEPWSDAAP